MTSQILHLGHGLKFEAVYLHDMVEYHVKRDDGKITANIFEGQTRYFEDNIKASKLPYLYKVVEAIKDEDFGRIPMIK